MVEPMLGASVVAQIALVVRDIEAVARRYASFLGVETPEILETDAYERSRTHYRGTPTRARARLAFFAVGPGLQMELIEPDREPSVWREYLDAYGEGVHHVAFAIAGMEDKIAALEAAGMPLVQRGEYEGGRYAYLDARGDLKILLELLEND